MLRVTDVGIGPDDRIGNYRVEHELGLTGSGVLLQARHQVLPRRAIIKVIHAAFASVRPHVVQTLREACILEAIGHPGVPIVYESGLLRDRRPWFAFEVIRGPTLEDRLAEGPLPAAEVARLMRDLAEILEHAHRVGVIHRGLRPDRIVLTHHRRYPLCIPDWSEAIAHDASASVPPVDGCRGYVAPELVHHDAGAAERVDDRADMFALGAIAYRALTGTVAADSGSDQPSYVAAHVLRPDAPRELAAMIDALLSYDRFDRPSAADVRADLEWLPGTMRAVQHRASSVAAPDDGDAEDCSDAGDAEDCSDAGDAKNCSDACDDGVPPRQAAPPPEPIVFLDQPRVRRPRWTPTVHYVETTDVDIRIGEDERTVR